MPRQLEKSPPEELMKSMDIQLMPSQRQAFLKKRAQEERFNDGLKLLEHSRSQSSVITPVAMGG